MLKTTLLLSNNKKVPPLYHILLTKDLKDVVLYLGKCPLLSTGWYTEIYLSGTHCL
jgi:hypothetical protein